MTLAMRPLGSLLKSVDCRTKGNAGGNRKWAGKGALKAWFILKFPLRPCRDKGRHSQMGWTGMCILRQKPNCRSSPLIGSGGPTATEVFFFCSFFAKLVSTTLAIVVDPEWQLRHVRISPGFSSRTFFFYKQCFLKTMCTGENYFLLKFFTHCI